MSCCKCQNTFAGWAVQIGLLTGRSVSKQAVFDRIHKGATAFAQELLQRVLLQQSGKGFVEGLFSAFGKVLLQDSTTLKLPQSLSAIFPGNHSHGEQKAIARIQSIINIKAMEFIDFVLGSYTQNDQSASGSILQWARKGDLVIRDMGYFAMDTFEKLIKAEIHFLSRLKYGVKLYDRQGNEIPLGVLLKGNKAIDQWVYIGVEKKLWIRLVMLPIPAEQRCERVRKAKQDRDKRLHHSRQYYQWLGYSVYITDVEKQIWSPKEVAKAYSVRWQIEIIFKSWKTGFHLQDMLHEGCGNEHRVRVSILLMLLFICLFMQKIYIRYKTCIEATGEKLISLVKLSVFICNNLREIFFLPDKQLKETIARHCCYDKRSDRINMTDLYQNSKN
jgi:Transposase DDE domain